MTGSGSRRLLACLVLGYLFAATEASATETITVDVAAVYKTAASDSGVIATLHKDDVIEIISTDGLWSRIAWENIAGWMHSAGYQGAEINKPKKKRVGLQSHEPNLLGYTWDSNDVEYLDFKISLKYPIFHDGQFKSNSWKLRLPFFYLGFTGRFGQYISTRESSPVIGKRFNPEILMRYWLDSSESYIDLSFGHESNGQSINSQSEFMDKQANFLSAGEDPDFARDYISRGWDYVGLNLRKTLGKQVKFVSDLKLRYFLHDGPFQGKAEEYNDWEMGLRDIHRRQYDGVTLHTAVRTGSVDWLERLSMTYTTGYKDTFRNNTFRIESRLLLWRLPPIMFWASKGYNSDLVDYYKRTTSFGLALELETYVGRKNPPPN